jgi:ABC-type transporter Mla subunit MlaD
MMGTTVGTVDDVQPDDNGNMSARLEIDAKFARFIHDKDRAIIHIPLALADPYIEIINDKWNTAPLPKDQPIVVRPETGATDTLNRTVEDIRVQTLPAILKLLSEYTQLAADLRDPHSPLQQSLARIDRLSARLEQNDNLAGRLFNDKALADSLTQSIQKVSASTDDLHSLIANLNLTAAELPKIARGASAEIDQLPALVDQTRKLLAEVTKAVHDLQQTTTQLPMLTGSLKQSMDQVPDVLAHLQQTLVEVQKLAKAMQDLPLVRDNVDHATQTQTLRPADMGGPP